MCFLRVLRRLGIIFILNGISSPKDAYYICGSSYLGGFRLSLLGTERNLWFHLKARLGDGVRGGITRVGAVVGAGRATAGVFGEEGRILVSKTESLFSLDWLIS